MPKFESTYYCAICGEQVCECAPFKPSDYTMTTTAYIGKPIELDPEMAKQVLDRMKEEFERATIANLFLDKLRPPKPELKIEIDHERDPFPISNSMFFRHAFYGWSKLYPYSVVSGMMDGSPEPKPKETEFEYKWEDVDEDCGQLPKI